MTLEEIYAETRKAGIINRKMAEASRSVGWIEKPPADYAAADVSLCVDAVRSYADALLDGDAHDLLLVGDAGRGKSFAALSILKAVEDSKAVMFVSETSMLAALRTAKTDFKAHETYAAAQARYKLPGVLVVDDMGHGDYGRGNGELLRDLINARRGEKGKVCIFTTQYDKGELSARFAAVGPKLAEAITSRLQQCAVIKLDGPDRRLTR